MSAITLSVADIDTMSDTELYNALKSYGLNVGPIVASTRGIYKKKLIEKIKIQNIPTSPIPGLNSSIRDDTTYRNDILSHTAEKSSRNSVERPDSSNRYGDINIHKNIADRKSLSHFSAPSATYDDQEGDDYELEEEEERYERHSPSKLSQSFSSYSRHSHDPSTSGAGLLRLSDYGRSFGDKMDSDYSATTHTRTVGSYRSSFGDLGSTAVGSSNRSNFGESASARADRILEDIRRRSTLSTGYKPISETDRLSRTRDILEQARQSGRVSKSQMYGAKQSVLSEYLLKIVIGLVLFACIYFVITSMTQPNAFHAIDQEVSEILKETEKTDAE